MPDVSSFALAPMQAGDLHIQSEWQPDAIRVELQGTADLAGREALESFLPLLHAEALRVHAATIIVSLRQLEFMNSSCFKSFVSWISKVQELDAAGQYKIRFLSSPAIHWQRRSLDALRCFAPELIAVELLDV